MVGQNIVIDSLIIGSRGYNKELLTHSKQNFKISKDIVLWVRAFDFKKGEREEGFGELCTQFCSANHSRDHAIHRPTTSVLFPVFATYQLIPGNLQNYVFTNGSLLQCLLQCNTLLAHISAII